MYDNQNDRGSLIVCFYCNMVNVDGFETSLDWPLLPQTYYTTLLPSRSISVPLKKKNRYGEWKQIHHRITFKKVNIYNDHQKSKKIDDASSK